MERQTDELLTLKVIAETLNRSDDMNNMLRLVLGKLLEVTDLKTGWIFLAEDEPQYIFAADQHLPPALARDNKAPMCTGVCSCLSQFWSGRLNQAVNIINCKRLGDAIRFNRGDTEGITHHATVPLSAGGEMFGVLNVASPHKKAFSDDELNLLQSVAFQIGTAIKRMKLFEIQTKRAKTYAKLDQVSRSIWEVEDAKEFPCQIVESIALAFQFDRVLFFLEDSGQMRLEADCNHGAVDCKNEAISSDLYAHFGDKPEVRDLMFEPDKETERYYWLPIKMGRERLGALAIRYNYVFHEIDEDGLKALADHLALGLENFRLNAQRQALNIIEERNRLARDLHDAVSQKLFSLSLTAKGAERVAGHQPELLKEALADIQKLSSDALMEMRALIWQLRPAPINKRLGEAAESYGRGLGLKISSMSRGEQWIPKTYREDLWRFIQEALNNIRKHAGVKSAKLFIDGTRDNIHMKITDNGRGFLVEEKLDRAGSLGLTSMRERIEKLGGELDIDSQPQLGTTLLVNIPLS
ncbi:histidine kinase [Camelliibacillus cellulosilyticus]|uniref:histidine kinase n=1 Tax=Camelliibacillus cellulosilyticus TaxID=2174486 RepID=A0ABV9GQT9_9BACL